MTAIVEVVPTKAFVGLVTVDDPPATPVVVLKQKATVWATVPGFPAAVIGYNEYPQAHDIHEA